MLMRSASFRVRGELLLSVASCIDAASDEPEKLDRNSDVLVDEVKSKLLELWD